MCTIIQMEVYFEGEITDSILGEDICEKCFINCFDEHLGSILPIFILKLMKIIRISQQ